MFGESSNIIKLQMFLNLVFAKTLDSTCVDNASVLLYNKNIIWTETNIFVLNNHNNLIYY